MSPSAEYSPASVADAALLGQMFEDYRPRLLAMVQRRIDARLAVRVDAEEVLQEAFVDAGRKWNQFRDHNGMSAYAWLYRIVFDRLIEIYRKHARGPRDVRRDVQWPEESSVMFGLNLISPTTSPSEAVARQERAERMQQALSLLKDEDREVLWMRTFDQLTFAEIGQVMEIKEGTATLRYVRALKKLKKVWQSLNGDGSYL